jgi:hypothetical protein
MARQSGAGAEQSRVARLRPQPLCRYDERSAPYGLFTGELPKGLPAMARVVYARRPGSLVAVSLAHLAEHKTIEYEGATFAWKAGKATALGASDIAKGKDVGSVEVTDAAGAALVHDVTFAFVLHAFAKNAIVLTDKGRVSLASGQVVAK